MNEVSLTRLYVLRAMYLLVVIGLALSFWPNVFASTKPFAEWDFFRGVQVSMMGAFWLLCVLGIRYPLQLLPILMWELLWKTIWLIAVPLPLWLNGSLDKKLLPNVLAIGLVILIYVAIPWSYVYHHYIKKQGDQWRNAKSTSRKQVATM
jgi:hypothetical protein